MPSSIALGRNPIRIAIPKEAPGPYDPRRSNRPPNVGAHPTTDNRDLDHHPHLPVSIGRRRPQPTVHGGVTAIDARPVMAVHIDPLEPDGIHNPAVSQPASARDRTPGPSGPPQPVMTDPTSASPSPKGTS